MKKIYSFLFLILAGFGAFAQTINFPDANFKAKLLQPNVAYDADFNDLTIDANADGEIQVSEAQLVRGLDISGAGISDLTGISNFTAMNYLNCKNNALTSLVLPSPISLEVLNASHNALTSITVDFASTVEGVDLSYNNLTSFVIESAAYFDIYDLSHNQLSSLVINDAQFDYFYVRGNNLSSIEINGGASVYSQADYSSNQFSLLDLTGFSFANETSVFLGNNVVDHVVFDSQPGNIGVSTQNTFVDLGNYAMTTSCDPENQGNVSFIDCPNLEYFILKNGFNHATITCNEGGNIFQNPALDLVITECPNLSFICVDEGEQANIQARIDQLGLQNQVQVNSYCTFTPGGTYYTISGSTKFDAGSDGCDAADLKVPFQKFTISNGSETQTITSDASGDYTAYVGEGAHTITPISETAYQTISPSSVNVDFPAGSSPFLQNFCMASLGVHPDLEISLLPTNVAVPGFDTHYKIVYRNKGNQTQSGTVSLSFQDAVLDLVSANPAAVSQNTNEIGWDFSDLEPFESREITIAFNLNSPLETPALNSGDILGFTAAVASAQTDETPVDNSASLAQSVVNSYDPNDKTCLEGNTVGPQMIGEYVHYLIRFENTGNFPAQNIVVKDVVDSTRFDIATLVPLQASHDFYTRISGDNVEFVFDNIQLPFDDATNDGYVAFKIKTKPTLAIGDTFSNAASIYFDYNFPIVTDPAVSTIQALGVGTVDFADRFVLYPNPASSEIFVKALSQEQGTVSVYGVSGQLLLAVPDAIGKAIDISRLSSGTYFVNVSTGNGTSVTRFVKQ